ncbi:MAG: hypothetical protein QXU32_10390 [Nitrososphaerales archaeon]
MEPIVLLAGSAAGAFTAIAMRKGKGNATLISNNTVPTHPIDLQRRVITEAINRVYDYEHQGKISGMEREKLLAKYRQELNVLNNNRYGVTLYDLKHINAFKESLVAIVDQRMAQINARLDDLDNKITNTAVQSKPVIRVERKEEKREITKPVERVEPVEVVESMEHDDDADASLDQIKKKIMQTLSRLEQAEVE